MTLPNRHCDLQIASEITNARLDEWVLCDEPRLDIMVNEQLRQLPVGVGDDPARHAGPSGQASRLLASRFLIALRTDPARLAEEIAYINVVSGARRSLSKGVLSLTLFAREFLPCLQEFDQAPFAAEARDRAARPCRHGRLIITRGEACTCD